MRKIQTSGPSNYLPFLLLHRELQSSRSMFLQFHLFLQSQTLECSQAILLFVISFLLPFLTRAPWTLSIKPSLFIVGEDFMSRVKPLISAASTLGSPEHTSLHPCGPFALSLHSFYFTGKASLPHPFSFPRTLSIHLYFNNSFNCYKLKYLYIFPPLTSLAFSLLPCPATVLENNLCFLAPLSLSIHYPIQ